jgi:hypothetical protein
VTVADSLEYTFAVLETICLECANDVWASWA